MSNLLMEAQELVYGERAKEYGDPKPHFEKVAARWSQIFGIDISPEQVVLAMLDLKMARLCHSIGHKDSWRDIAGYVAVADLLTGEEGIPNTVPSVELVLEQVKAEVAKPEPKPAQSNAKKDLTFAKEMQEFKSQTGMTYPKIAKATGIALTSVIAYGQGKFKPSMERQKAIRDYMKGYSPASSKPEPKKSPAPEVMETPEPVSPKASQSGLEFKFGQEAAFTLLKDYATGKVIEPTWPNLALVKQKEKLMQWIRDGKEDRVWDLLEGGVTVAR